MCHEFSSSWQNVSKLPFCAFDLIENFSLTVSQAFSKGGIPILQEWIFKVGRKPWKLAYKGVRPTLKMNPVNNPGLVFLFSHFYWGSIRPFFIEWSVNGMFFQFWWKDATQWWGLVQKKAAEACLRKGSSVQAARDSFPFNQNSFWSIYFSSLHPNGLIWLFLIIKEFAP